MLHRNPLRPLRLAWPCATRAASRPASILASLGAVAVAGGFAMLLACPATAHAEDDGLRSPRLLSGAEPFLLDLDEVWRRGDFDRELGMLRPRDRAEAWHFLSVSSATPVSSSTPASRSPASEFAAAWLGPPPPATLPLGFRIDADLRVLGFAADPHRQLHPVFPDVREGEDVDPAWRARLGFSVDAILAKGLSAYLRFVLDTDGRNDPHNRTRDFSQLGASNNLDQAYLRYTIGPAAFTLGRRFLDWGPSRYGSLILSSLAPAPDQLHAELVLGKHRLQAFVGRLSSESAFIPTMIYDPQTDELSEIEIETTLTRHVYGHRLEFTLWNWGNLGLSELALVSRPSGGLDLGYLNPVGIHVVNETEQSGGNGDEVNVLHQLDAEVWLKGWHLHGAFLVDDLQIDSEPRKTWPDQLAGSIGVDRSLGSRTLVSYEYRRMGSWTYLHRGAGTSIRQFGRPLAAPEGPDMDRHLLDLSWRPASSAQIWLKGERRRRGINRIYTQESREGHAGESFPREPVERRWVGRLGGRWSFTPWLHTEAQVSYHDIDAVNNSDRDEDILEFRFFVRIFSPPVRFLFGDS